MGRVILSTWIVFLSLAGGAKAAVRHVPGDYNTIQAAIDACSNGDVVVIAPGTYTGNGNRDIDFRGKAIAVRGVEPNAPNIVSATVIDCLGSESEPHRGFRFDSGEGPDSLLAGLTITNGYGLQERLDAALPMSAGGGIFCKYASPSILKCKIEANQALYGGGFYLTDCAPRIIQCNIVANKTIGWPVGKNGAGICCFRSSPLISHCDISDNTAQGDGGGIFCYYSSNPIITNCMISRNKATVGSAVFVYWHSSPTIQQCNVVSSEADKYGTGRDIYCSEGAPVITGCTIVNTSGAPSLWFFDNDSAVLRDCIIWGPNPSCMDVWGPLNVSFCNIKGGYPGVGNIDSDPCFADPDQGDYHLSVTSPCVNTGDPSYNDTGQTDIDGDPRVMNGRVDMGADENLYIGPLLYVSPTALSTAILEDSTDCQRQNITVGNVGTGSLDWNASHDCSWLRIEPGTGLSLMGNQTFVVEINPSGLPAGVYHCSLDIVAEYVVNSPRHVQIELTIVGPKMSLSRSQFVFNAVQDGGNPADQLLTIKNGGGGTLDWHIQNGCPWLEIDPVAGVLKAAEIQQVRVSADITGLAAGSYQCHLFVGQQDQNYDPETVEVVLDVAHSHPLVVPTDYQTIQAAINEAANGDIVIIEDGIYLGNGNRDIDFLGKAITLKSRNGPTGCVVDCQGTQAQPHRGFILQTGEATDSVIMGLTVKNGYAEKGGGIYCTNSSGPTISGCVLVGCTGEYGGGICIETGGHCTPIIANCLVVGNKALTGRVGGYGGGISFVGCGGGREGSGCWLCDFHPQIRNCTIVGNAADSGGGGIFTQFACISTITNCIIRDNIAPIDREICIGLVFDACNPKCTVSHSNIKDGLSGIKIYYYVTWGEGNIDVDPHFADPNGGDYHLQSQGGRWEPRSRSWVRDELTSACIDAGDIDSPVGFEPFPNGGVINMGAYGGTNEASKSYFGEPVCETIFAGDINGDCKVDFDDLGLMMLHWLGDPAGPRTSGGSIH